MIKVFLPLLLLLLYVAGYSQSGESISYYYKGKKVYYPVSYNRIVAELAPGYTFTELKSAVAKLIAVPEDSLQETLTNKQFIIKLGNNKAKSSIISYFAKLSTSSGILFSRPVFVTPSGKYNSYGKEFIVKLKAGTSFSSLQDIAAKNGCSIVRKYPFQDDMYIMAAGKMSGYDGLAMANLFYETGLFDYAEPDKIVYNALHVAPPNDPLYNLQWAHSNTGSPAQYSGIPGEDMKVLQAWDITMGAPYIKIGVIDEGVDLTHPDLQANLLQGFNGSTMTSDPGDGAPLSPDRAHGTNCAGIIAAVANNNIGVAGVAPNCKIIPAVIFDATGTYMGDAAVAGSFDYVRLQGADIISNSWGGGSVSSTIDAAIDRAVTLGRHGKGCMVLFSSGNDNAASVLYPASNSQVISVGGVAMCGKRKNNSSCDGETYWGANFGAGLDVVAPCVKIASTDIQGAGGYNTNAGTAGDYNNTFNGTSSACPNAAGVAALILSVDSSMTVAQATKILELSCDKLAAYTYVPNSDPNQPNGTWNNETGHGRVNAYAAVQLAGSGYFCSVQIVASARQICNSPVILSINSPNAGTTYEWRKNGTIAGSGTTYMATSPGNYDAIISACNAISNAIAVTNAALVAAVAAPDTICTGGSSVLTATALINTPDYCATIYRYGTSEGDYISQVSIAGTALNNASAGAASPYYTLYPQSGNTTATISANTAYVMSVKGGTWSTCYIRGWIDYNRDGVFDPATESIGISGNVGSETLGTINFTVPAGAVNGITRLRLRSSDTDPGPSTSASCGTANSGYGEAEDYIITITNGVAPFTYSWMESPAGTTLVSNNTAQVTAANILQNTTYKVTATSANGCVANDSAAVNIRFINSSVSKTDAGCFGSATGSLTITPTNGTAPYTYRPGTTGSFGSSNTFSNLKAGNYRVSVRDANGCAGISSQLTILQQPSVTSTFAVTNTTCYGTSTGAFTVTADNGTPPYQYRFGTRGAFGNNNTFTNLRAASYRIYVQDANGCTVNSAAVVTQPSAVSLTFTKTDVSCSGKNDGTIHLTGAGGTSPYMFRLGTVGGYSSASSFTNLKPGNYRAFVQDANGCAGASVSISIAQSLDPCNPDGKAPMAKAGLTPFRQLEIALSPNPSGSRFTLITHAATKVPVEIRVLDVNGKSVYTAKGSPEQSFRFGETFMSGTYLVEVRQGNEVKTVKAVKIR